MTFDPNTPSNDKGRKLNYDYLWATYIPDRTPKFKIHGIRGQAISAVKYRSRWSTMENRINDPGVKLYKRDTVDSPWVEVQLKETYHYKESIIKE